MRVVFFDQFGHGSRLRKRIEVKLGRKDGIGLDGVIVLNCNDFRGR